MIFSYIFPIQSRFPIRICFHTCKVVRVCIYKGSQMASESKKTDVFTVCFGVLEGFTDVNPVDAAFKIVHIPPGQTLQTK